jgi:hypothetical protein
VQLLLNLRKPTWRMVCNWTWSVMATHVPWKSILKHGGFNCGSMYFWVFSRTRSLIKRPRHLRNISTQTLQSSLSSSGIFVPWVLKHSYSLIQLHVMFNVFIFPPSISQESFIHWVLHKRLTTHST